MNIPVRPELPTTSVGSSQAPTAAVDNSAPHSTRPQSTYKSGNVVQTSGATFRFTKSFPRTLGRTETSLYILSVPIKGDAGPQ